MEKQANTRIGILGGSFNPIHLGHLILAQTALEAHDLAQVLFVPCCLPPHKSPAALLDARHRLAMVEAAIEGDWRFEASGVEIQRGGVSYAVDTVREFSRLQPSAELFFIVGADELPGLHGWKSIYDLLPLCTFLTFARPGHDLSGIGAADIRLDAPWPERLLHNVTASRMVDISSTEIRYRVAEGLSIRYLVPQAVEMYIAEHRLYSR